MFFFAFSRFDSILLFQSPEELDKLYQEFIEFQVLQDENIPQVWDKATVKVDTDNDKFYHWMDIIGITFHR